MSEAQVIFMKEVIFQAGYMIIQLLILFLITFRFNMVIKENMI